MPMFVVSPNEYSIAWLQSIKKVHICMRKEVKASSVEFMFMMAKLALIKKSFKNDLSAWQANVIYTFTNMVITYILRYNDDGY